MKTFHYYLDIDLHRKYFFISVSMALLLTNGMIVYSTTILIQSIPGSEIPEFLTHMASYALLANSQLILTTVYLYLLLNAKVRFNQLNWFLR